MATRCSATPTTSGRARRAMRPITPARGSYDAALSRDPGDVTATWGRGPSLLPATISEPGLASACKPPAGAGPGSALRRLADAQVELGRYRRRRDDRPHGGPEADPCHLLADLLLPRAGRRPRRRGAGHAPRRLGGRRQRGGPRLCPGAAGHPPARSRSLRRGRAGLSRGARGRSFLPAGPRGARPRRCGPRSLRAGDQALPAGGRAPAASRVRDRRSARPSRRPASSRGAPRLRARAGRDQPPPRKRRQYRRRPGDLRGQPRRLRRARSSSAAAPGRRAQRPLRRRLLVGALRGGCVGPARGSRRER